jgi:signal transduction histidine kinase
LSPVEVSRKVQILLLDTQGAVVLAPDASIAIGTRLPFLGDISAKGHPVRWSDGVDYLTAQVPTGPSGAFKGLGWRVVVRQPTSAAFETVNQLRNLFVLGGLSVGCIAALIAWVVAGLIVKPVSELASAASALATGENLHSAFGQDDGHPSEVVAVRRAFKRVTGEALERAEGLLKQLDSVYLGAPVGLCVVDKHLRYLRINHVWADAFGLNTQDSLGTKLVLPVNNDEFSRAIKSTLNAQTSPVAQVEIETFGPRGPRIWQTGMAPLGTAAGTTEGASIVLTDITSLKLAEQALRMADARKNNFVAMLAHELRNPLAPIVNAVRVLERSPSETQAKRMRGVIQSQINHMVRLIDDLLDVSRVNHNKVTLNLEWLSVSECCLIAVDAVRPLLQAKEQHFEMKLDEAVPLIHADSVRIAQVVGNLLNNASKFTQLGGNIRLEASSKQGCVEIVVTDTGRGIEASLLPHVFELFTQGNVSLDRTEGGLGIGLSIVNNLVAMHGGTVVAQSDGPERGSRFIVKLPICHSSAAALEPLSTPVLNT